MDERGRMTYATREDLVERYGAAEIADLEAAPRDGDTGDEAAAAAARVAAALADAAAEIDAGLAPRYTLPLPAGPWPRLRAIACDLARQRLYDDVPPEVVTERARRARRALGILAAEGGLVDAAGQPAPVRSDSAARSRGPKPTLTRAALEGF